MCRHLAYVGSPLAIGELLFDAPHALCTQGCAPREMVVAKDNPDGWGVAWWDPGVAEPHHYRCTARMWDDHGFLNGTQRATTVLGAVRKASPNTTLESVNNAPFVAGSRLGALAFSLNGHVFHQSCGARVRDAIPPEVSIVGDTDSEAVFAIIRAAIAAGSGAAAAVAAAHHVIAPNHEVYVNLLLVTRDEIVATTWQHTLYVRHVDGATTVSSEALDSDPVWERVPDASLLVASCDDVTTTPLEGLR